MLYTSLYSLFKAQQIILYEISSIATVNNELCGRQGKGRIKRGCVHFDTPSLFGLAHYTNLTFIHTPHTQRLSMQAAYTKQ